MPQARQLFLVDSSQCPLEMNTPGGSGVPRRARSFRRRRGKRGRGGLVADRGGPAAECFRNATDAEEAPLARCGNSTRSDGSRKMIVDAAWGRAASSIAMRLASST